MIGQDGCAHITRERPLFSLMAAKSKMSQLQQLVERGAEARLLFLLAFSESLILFHGYFKLQFDLSNQLCYKFKSTYSPPNPRQGCDTVALRPHLTSQLLSAVRITCS
jgi:hypothetical protein